MKNRSLRMRNFVSGDPKLSSSFYVIKPPSYSNQTIEGRTFKLGNFFSKNFSESTLKNVRFEQLNLSSAVFKDAVLNNVTFINCNTSSAVFEDALLNNVTFSNCNLTGVDFRGCTLKNVKFIEKSTVSSCYFFYAFLQDVSFDSSTIENINFNFNTNYFEEDKDKDGIYSGLNFNNAIVKNVDFSGTEERILRYREIKFNNATLTNVNLSYSKFENGSFVDARINGNTMNEGNFEFYNYKLSLDNTNFFKANLSGARFKLDELNVLDFENVNFDGTNLVNTIFENIGFKAILFSSETKFGDRNSRTTATTFINCKYVIDSYIINNILLT